MKGPTNADIQAAIETLAQAYHEFVGALTAREAEDRRLRENDRIERRELRQRLDQFFGRLDFIEKKIDRQFDQRDQEFDQFKEETERRQDETERRLLALEEARAAPARAVGNGTE